MRSASGDVRPAGTARALPRAVAAAVVVLALLVLVSVGRRLTVDVPNLASGAVPDPDEFDHRYALHPVLAYLHIAVGVVYLVGAPVQLSRRVRSRHLALHRRMGRVVLPAGLLTGVSAILAGVVFPFDGFLEVSATVVFGAYMIAALVTAYVAVRARDIARHRRWMIRAFAAGVAVGTQRVWLGVLVGPGGMPFEQAFGVAFWLAFVVNVLAAEVYLLRVPVPATLLRPTTRRPGSEAVAHPPLAVLTREVGDAAGGWEAAECGVSAVVIVGV